MSRNTSHAQIIEYWQKNCPYEERELNVDILDMDSHCWNCGDDKRSGNKVRLEKCHIIPACLGGEDAPSNYVLLCHSCHRDAPNCTDKDAMWIWIRSNYSPMSFYGTYSIRKALIEFKRNKGYSFLMDVAPKLGQNIEDILRVEMKKVSPHGVDKINTSTLVHLLNTIESKYAGK